MKSIAIKDCTQIELPMKTYDLAAMKTHDCIGCFSCWNKTPGKCVFHDLDQYYHDYVTADKAVFFVPLTKGFISGRLKTLFDRMIPLFLPYTSLQTGESMHVPRYEKYPDIKAYYSGDFMSTEEEMLFKDYIYRVFYQFHSKQIDILPMTEYREADLL